MRKLLLLPFVLFMSLEDLQAQGGSASGGCSIGEGFQCGFMAGHENQGPQKIEWMRALLLWRIDDDRECRNVDPAKARNALKLYREVSRRIEDLNRSMVGSQQCGRMLYASVSRFDYRATKDTIFAAGQQFLVPYKSDSTLVLVMDARGKDAEAPTLLTVAWARLQLDEKYWGKDWVSGDTSFSIQPRDPHLLLRDALLKNDQLRAVLLGTP